ncbi:MAG: hypothetical protein VB078_10865 [Clostridiaceae bacterium]|nr:hypothetical protein [Clostridiaceae bacterium]
MTIIIKDFEPLPVPEIKPIEYYRPVPDIDFRDMFSEDEIADMRKSAIEYMMEIMKKGEQK